MYHPYFRGKQFELITIRETAELLAQSDFVPIIEPVKDSLSGLDRTLKSVCDAKGKAIVIVNPSYGDHAENGDGISALLSDEFKDQSGITAGILLTSDMTIGKIVDFHEKHKQHNPTFVHAGFSEGRALAEKLGDDLASTRHVFFEKYCSKPYRKHFKEGQRILLYDGFNRMRNADYPPVEKFSDLHIIYEDDGMNGFGDFLIVGDDFSEGGGPAYAVAIHLTFIDPDQDDVMYIYHFVSTTNSTPTDPAGKFSQALDKLIEKLDSGKSNLFESSAIKELRELHIKKHFPGLGHVKKLSMKHHIETLANFFSLA
ncbi:sce7725 family protein [Burkholderia sp. AU30198]|uniref:sce7725 family protein n=1 Tax=Burkholderia sp. AU30198 TaxID=2879627 RepID=UPI001CF22C6A|nr:sce7725 family protein [Burkholderia sp. AU30198]MCA8298792.1 sce7725 family protein [Burkholderia sp. AU30198]